ncbi:hypothetical protein [Moraxella sp. ZY200743]|uniref:hypothetical protein n=1 Tax=Moraxella sp. ZY200743 TaxID=2911970 RepID=UPI003D7D28BD
MAFEPLAKCLEPNFAMQEEYREIARLRKQLQQVLDGCYLSSLISQNDRLKKENETLQPKLQPNINRYGTLSEQLEQQTQTETINDLQQQNNELQDRIAELESRLATQSANTTPAEVVINATEEMQIINEVYREFWENHKSNEMPPKKDTIVDWIISEYGVSHRIAHAIDSIVRPKQYRMGGQKTR